MPEVIKIHTHDGYPDTTYLSSLVSELTTLELVRLDCTQIEKRLTK